jgi:hypothetical protein
LARQDWEQRAGWAGAHREAAYHHGDETDPLGVAPAPGMVEKAAGFRTAHEALGLVDVGAEEAGMSDGQLRARYNALKREEAWAPRHVDDYLATAHQAEARARSDAAVWTAHADSPGADDDEIEALGEASEQAAAQADIAARATRDLEEVDQARASWYTETAVARDNAHRAGAELRARGIDPEAPDDRVTADEWIESHRVEQADADQHREITEDYELDDHDRAVDGAPVNLDEQLTETDVADIREVSTPGPGERAAPVRRDGFPTLDETAENVARAQLALHEIENRRQYEHTAETVRADELTRWDANDHATDDTQDPADADSDVDVLER